MMKHKSIAVFLGLILAGCSGVMTAPENGGGQRDGSAGNLTVRIGYSPFAGRTAYPTHDGATPLDYTLEFAWTGGGDLSPTHDPVSVSPGIPASLRLETGSWNITAKAMAEGVEKANGSAAVTVTESGNAIVAITLSPAAGAPATGTLGYTLYFPVGATGSLNIADADGSPVGSPVSSFDSGTEGTIPNLNPGSYLVTVTLTGGGKTAGRTEAAHIVAGLTTKVAYNFYEDLASAPKPVASVEELEKIGVDGAWPLSGSYALTQDITLTGWVPLGSTANPFSGSFDGGGNTITINSFDATALEDDLYIGIFAAVQGIPENKARVKNLNIASSVSIAAMSTTIGQGIGLASGYAEDAVISGVNLSGSLSIAEATKVIFAGGIVGDMRTGAELRDCGSAMALSAASSGTGTLTADPPYAGATTAIGGLAGFLLTSADGSKYGEGKDALIKDCANSGDITVNYASTNTLVGGIAGGWMTANTDPYLGRIEDCVYTGDLSSTMGVSRSGGIAGAIGGNGGNAANGANTSRILQCRTVGNIKGTSRTGGIVGIATYGALIERCSSDVTMEKVSLAGASYICGIAGTLAQGARISDCWSDGSIEGDAYAAGIGGFETGGGAIQRCYSRAAVAVTGSPTTWAVGGICAGLPNVINVTLCVALNNSIVSPAVALASNTRGRVKRIAASLSGTLSATAAVMNYAPDFPVAGPISGWVYDSVRDGTILEDDPPEQWLYEVTLGWDFDEVWVMGGDGYPRLRGVDN
jgi:hypothetical protein